MKITFLLVFTSITIIVFSQNNDSNRNGFNFFYNQRSLYAVEDYEPFLSPIKNNHLKSFTLNYDFNIVKNTKYSLRGSIGINSNLINFGYQAESGLLDPNFSSINATFLDLNIQNSIYLERIIFKIKNTTSRFSLGVLSNGTVNGRNEDIQTFKFQNAFGKNDEIRISKKQNNLYNLYPIVQLNFSSVIKNLKFNYGTRMLIGNEFSENMNYEYQIIQDRQFSSLRQGQFKDNRIAWELFLGINI